MSKPKKTKKNGKGGRKKHKAPSRKQTEIPGAEAVSIPELDRAAGAYVEARDARMALTPPEHEAKQKVIDLMQKHDVEEYVDEEAGLKLTLKAESFKLEVKKLKTAKPEAAE